MKTDRPTKNFVCSWCSSELLVLLTGVNVVVGTGGKSGRRACHVLVEREGERERERDKVALLLPLFVVADAGLLC